MLLHCESEVAGVNSGHGVLKRRKLTLDSRSLKKKRHILALQNTVETVSASKNYKPLNRDVHSHVEEHSLRLRVVLQRSLATLSSDAALLNAVSHQLINTRKKTARTYLVTAKRNRPANKVEHVNPRCPRLELVRDPHSPLIVIRMHTCSKAIASIISEGNDFLLVLELGDRDHRTKDLLLDNLHIRRNVREDSRLDEVASA